MSSIIKFYCAFLSCPACIIKCCYVFFVLSSYNQLFAFLFVFVWSSSLVFFAPPVFVQSSSIVSFCPVLSAYNQVLLSSFVLSSCNQLLHLFFFSHRGALLARRPGANVCSHCKSGQSLTCQRYDRVFAAFREI